MLPEPAQSRFDAIFSSHGAYQNNPFTINPSLLPVGTGEQEDIIDIQCDEAARTKHKECAPLNFWLSISSAYLSLARNAIPHLLVFPCTWEGEQGFSAMMSIKPRVGIVLMHQDMTSDVL